MAADRSVGASRARRRLRAAITWSALALLLSSVVLGIGGRRADAHTPHDDISDVVVSPSYARDGRVFVIAANRLLVSTGGPYHWKPLVRGLPRAPEDGKSLDRVAISASDADVMYVTSRVGGVFRSADAGASWRRAAGGLGDTQITPIAISPADPNVVLASGSISGLYRTTDGGAQWTPVSGFGRVPAIAFVPGTRRAVVGDSAGRVSVSDDDGATWAQVASEPGQAISAVAASTGADPAKPATVFAGTGRGRLLRSDDGGDTFAAVGAGLPKEAVNSIGLSATYPDDRTLWVSMASKGVYRSTDGGRTWVRASRGLTTDLQAMTVDVDLFRTVAVATGANGDRTLFEAGFDGLSRSDDDGRHWASSETLVDYIAGLDVSPDYAKDSTVAVASYVKGAYLSTTSGKNWKLIDKGLEFPLSEGNKFAPVRRLHNIVFSPEYATDRTLFSASWTSFLKSTDAGRSWSSNFVSAPPPDTVLRQFVIAVSPAYASDRTIFLGTRQGDVYRSDRAGDDKSWKLVGNAGSRVRTLVIDPGFPRRPGLYAGTENGVMKSGDAGATWTRTGPGGLSMLAISPAYDTDGTLFAGTEAGLSVTRDQSKTWTELAAPPLSATSLVEAIAVSPAYKDDQTLLVSVSGAGLYRSTDGGASFVEVGTDLTESNHVIADFTNPSGTPIQFSPAFAKDRTVFAYSGQDVVRSTDAGDTWDVLRLPSATAYLRTVDPALLADTSHGDPSTQPAGRTTTDDGRDRKTFVAIGVGGLVVLGVTIVGGVLFLRGRRRRAGSKPPD